MKGEKEIGEFENEENLQHMDSPESKEECQTAEESGKSEEFPQDGKAESKGLFDDITRDVEISQSSKTKDKGPVPWFHINEKYMAICRYALFVIIASILLYMLVAHWGQTMEVLSHFVSVLTPFLIGILITYFLTPLVARVEGILSRYITKGNYKKVTLVVAMTISYIVVLGFIVVAIVFVVPPIVDSLKELTEKLPAMYNHVAKMLADLQKAYPEINLNEINKQLAGMVPDLVEHGTNLVGNVLPMVYSVSVSIVRLAINIVLGIVVSLYLIYSKDKFRHQAKRLVYALFSEERGDVFCTTFRECNDIFSAFLISKAIDSLIIGCICCVAMNILGLPYAVLLSVIVGITNMIPYFGPFIGAIPGVLIYLCIDLESAIIFAIMILVLQQFDGLILGPRLLGQSTGLSPIWVIFAITLGGAYFGVVGMFIGVPIVAVVAFLLDKLIKSRLKGRQIRGLQEFENSEE